MNPTPAPSEHRLRRLFLTGLLTLLPVWLTWVVVKFVFVLLSGIGRPLVEPVLNGLAAGAPSLAWLAQPWVMAALALLATIVVILFAGWLARRVVGTYTAASSRPVPCSRMTRVTKPTDFISLCGKSISTTRCAPSGWVCRMSSSCRALP